MPYDKDMPFAVKICQFALTYDHFLLILLE